MGIAAWPLSSTTASSSSSLALSWSTVSWAVLCQEIELGRDHTQGGDHLGGALQEYLEELLGDSFPSVVNACQSVTPLATPPPPPATASGSPPPAAPSPSSSAS